MGEGQRLHWWHSAFLVLFIFSFALFGLAPPQLLVRIGNVPQQHLSAGASRGDQTWVCRIETEGAHVVR